MKQFEEEISMKDQQQQQQSFSFEIDNFSERKAAISSRTFSIDECEWFLSVHPKGYLIRDYVSVFLYVSNPKSLRTGWSIRANYSFSILSQSGKELIRTQKASDLFCAEVPAWGHPKVLPIDKLQEEGFLENNILIIKVEVKVVEIVPEGEVTGKEMFNFKGFDVLYPQIHLVSWIFAEHPDFTKEVRIKNQLVKSAYMNVLLGLIETLNKPPRSLIEIELRNAQSQLIELTEAGFKLDWLETKFEEVLLETKNAVSDGSQNKELEEHVNNLKLELENEKAKSLTAFDKVLTLEKTVSDLKLELEKERLVKCVPLKLASLKDAAVCFWNTTNLGIQQRSTAYQKV